MKIKEASLSNDNLIIKNTISQQATEKKKQLEARKKIEDYIADKKLRESIGDFDFGF